jgi:hypothetical protein
VLVDLLLDPDKALDAVNKAVSLVKKASQTAQNVESLGPLLGRYFDAKANALACVQKAKASGSSMGKAIELEMALESQRQFEEDLKNLFFSSGKMDIWQKIKARAAAMELEAAKAAGAEKRAREKKAKENQEAIEMVIGVSLAVVVVIGLIWGVYEVMAYCRKAGCG